jgi:DNA-binding transcriptional MerR regulator
LRAIKHLLYDEGYTIKGVQRLFKEQGARALASRPVLVDAAGGAQAIGPQFADVATDDEAEDFQPQSRNEPKLSAAEIDSLRAALADLAECDRILTQARTR